MDSKSSRLFKILNKASFEKSVVGLVGQLSAGGLNLLPLNFPPMMRILVDCLANIGMRGNVIGQSEEGRGAGKTDSPNKFVQLFIDL